MLAYVNGRILAEEEATVSVRDRGWLYGDGVFETMRTFGSAVFKLDDHLRRLNQSASLIGIKIPLSNEELGGIILDLIARENPPGEIMVRLTISRGVGGEGLFPRTPLDPTVVILLRELPVYTDETFSLGWKLITARTIRNSESALDPRIKATNFLNNILAKREAVEAGVDDALMQNGDGFVAESTTSNFFIVRDEILLTPPVEAGILAGITRQTVLEIAENIGMIVEERLFRTQDVYSADEAFLTLTSAGIIPVTGLDGREIGSGTPGPAVASLRSAYAAHVDAFIRGD